MGLFDFIDAEGKVRPDTDVEAAVREALRRYYELRPVGSETAGQLEDRIVGVFVQRYRLNWNQWAETPEEIIGDVNFHGVVAEISPLSVRLPGPADPIVRVDDFTQPTPGSVPAPSDWGVDKWLAVLRLGWTAYTEDRGRALALELAQNPDAQIPKGVQVQMQRTADNRAWLILGGSAAAVGIIAWLAWRSGRR